MTDVYEALYRVNKHAKKYAEQATQRYRNGKKTAARKNSVRKDALYSVKSTILQQQVDEVDTVEKHRIDGNLFYCLYFDDWSFHVPVEELDPPTEPESVTELDDFEKSTALEHTDLSLKEALTFLYDQFDVNANDHLQQEYVEYGYDSYFIGWKYLDEE